MGDVGAVAVALVALLGSTDIVAVDDLINAPRTLFGRTRAAVERALGPPTAVRPRALPPAPGAPLEAVDELTYPGLAIAVSRRSSRVRRVTIDEPRWPLPRDLNVGSSRARVQAVLGEPQLVSDVSVLYVDADGFPNTVELHFRDDRVRRIEWSFAGTD
jgi:hypothetical protein